MKLAAQLAVLVFVLTLVPQLAIGPEKTHWAVLCAAITGVSAGIVQVFVGRKR